MSADIDMGLLLSLPHQRRRPAPERRALYHRCLVRTAGLRHSTPGSYCYRGMAKRENRTSRLPIATLAILVLVLPPIIVHLIPTDTPEPYVFEATVGEELGRSTNGQLVYFDVDPVRGRYPDARMAIAIDRSYTRGASPEEVATAGRLWLQGSLMTPEVFYGEQYLFFGKPQVYIRQVKTGMLWPDQVTELKILYLSPVTTLAAPFQLPFLIRSEEMTGRVLAVLLARLTLVAVMAVIVIRRAKRKEDVLVPVLAYAVITILVTAPILGHLY